MDGATGTWRLAAEACNLGLTAVKPGVPALTRDRLPSTGSAKLRQAYREGQEDQLGVLDAVVLWNTSYTAVAASRGPQRNCWIRTFPGGVVALRSPG